MGFWGAASVIENRIAELDRIAWSRQLVGEGLSEFDIVFRDGSYWKKADSSNPAKARPPFGILKDTTLSGLAGDIIQKGLVSNGAWTLTSGARAFLASGGGAVATPSLLSGNSPVVLGYAVGAKAIELNPEPTVQLGLTQIEAEIPPPAEVGNSGEIANYESEAAPPASYATTQNGEKNALANNNARLVLGQEYVLLLGVSKEWYIWRGGLVFDPSTSIPSGITVVSAILSLYGENNYSDTDFDITLVSGADLADTFVNADYLELLNDTASLGSINTSAFLVEAWNNITLNAAGIAAVQTAINTGIKIRFGLRSSRDISATNPDLGGGAGYYDEYIEAYGFNTVGKYPKLTITYTIP